MKILIGILVSWFFWSCSGTKNLPAGEVYGRYEWNKRIRLPDGSIAYGGLMELRKDMTFEYNWVKGMDGGRTSGTWELHRNKIVLTSELQPPPEGVSEYQVLKTDSGAPGSVVIKIVDPDHKPVPIAHWELKGNVRTWGVSDRNGQAILPVVDADTLIISKFGYKTIRYPLTEEIRCYEFQMKAGHDSYRYFTGEVWEYRRKRLYPATIMEDRNTKNYFKKVKQ